MVDGTRCEDEVAKALCWLEDRNAIGVCRDAVIVDKLLSYGRLDKRVYDKRRVEEVLELFNFVNGGKITIKGSQWGLKIRLPYAEMTDEEVKNHVNEIRKEVKERWGIERKKRDKNKAIRYKGAINALESSKNYERLTGVAINAGETTVTLTFANANRAYQAAEQLLKFVDKTNKE